MNIKAVSRLLLIIAFCFSGQFFILSAEESNFRLRINQLPQDYTKDDIKAEIQFGRNLAATILARHTLLKNQNIQRYVNLLGSGVAAQVGRPELIYYFAVIEEEDINAYACPGGYIFVTKGALYAMKNEAQLAGVIAHEIGHVNRRHIVKQLKIRGKDSSLSSGIAAAIGGTTASARILFEQLTEKAYQLLFEEGVSQEMELESDEVGIEALITLSYDWKSYRDYLIDIKALLNTDHGKVINKTHPSIGQRVNNINAFVQQYELQDYSGKTNTSRFASFIPLK